MSITGSPAGYWAERISATFGSHPQGAKPRQQLPSQRTVEAAFNLIAVPAWRNPTLSKAAPCEALKWCRLETLGVVGKRPFFGLAAHVSLIRLQTKTVSTLRGPVAGSLEKRRTGEDPEQEAAPKSEQILNHG